MLFNTARSVSRLLLGRSLLRNAPLFFSSQKDARFLRFIDLDAKYLSEIPWIFKPIQPYIHAIRDFIFEANQLVGLPWWAIVIITSCLSRAIIFPLIFVQMRKLSRIGPVSPILVHMKEVWNNSSLPFNQKIRLYWAIYSKLAKNENFRLRTVFVYNLAYYPLLVSMIFSLRSLFSIEAVSKSGFLYINSLADIDPYYILPTLTILCYYWNLQRFIKPQNKHTIFSKIRSVCQVLLIVWYPFLCCWPSGITLYMFCNALISVLQSSLTTSVWFRAKLNPKVMQYNMLLATAENDKRVSESIIHAIKTGDESLKQKAIQESVLVSQTQEMVKKLNKQLEEQQSGKFDHEDQQIINSDIDKSDKISPPADQSTNKKQAIAINFGKNPKK